MLSQKQATKGMSITASWTKLCLRNRLSLPQSARSRRALARARRALGARLARARARSERAWRALVSAPEEFSVRRDLALSKDLPSQLRGAMAFRRIARGCTS